MVKEKIIYIVNSKPYLILVIVFCFYSIFFNFGKLSFNKNGWANLAAVLTIALTFHLLWFNLRLFYKRNSSTSKMTFPNYNLLRLTSFLYSIQTQKEIFEPITADWQEEYFEALFNKEIWKTRWINVRYTYAFLAAMWMKSPIGDLIQFVIKIAKP